MIVLTYEILKLNVVGISMSMINIILELRHYMWKLENDSSVLMGSLCRWSTLFWSLCNLVFVNNIISLALRHLREI